VQTFIAAAVLSLFHRGLLGVVQSHYDAHVTDRRCQVSLSKTKIKSRNFVTRHLAVTDGVLRASVPD